MTGARVAEQVQLKSPQEIEKMRAAGRVVAMVLQQVSAALRPGITTRELDEMAESLIMEMGCRPAFKGYANYPATMCISVNDEVVHGIPGERVLEPGDLVSLDVGAIFEGFYADAALTASVGAASPQARRLMRVTKEALHLGIAQAKPGATIGDVATAVERHVEKNGYSVVRDLSGHGIGREMHEPPQVPNFVSGASRRQLRLPIEVGTTLAIEPMVNEGGPEILRDGNGWTYRTRDGHLSAHFEHTIVVRESGPEILTRL